MNPTIYNIALTAHIVGITIMGGTTFIDFITFRQFRAAFPNDKVKGIILEDNLYKLQRFMGIGMALIIISGIGMMAYLHQVWGQQLWFRVKMGVLILIIINGLGFRRMLGAKLKKLLSIEPWDSSLDSKLNSLSNSMRWVHVFQMLFFLVIFTLSVFKFN